MEDLTNNERAAMIERAKKFCPSHTVYDGPDELRDDQCDEDCMVSFTLTETESLRQQLAEYEGIEGRCSVGHNKRFTYELLGQIGCVACERDEADRELSEARSVIDSIWDVGHNDNCIFCGLKDKRIRAYRDSKEKHDNGD